MCVHTSMHACMRVCVCMCVDLFMGVYVTKYATHISPLPLTLRLLYSTDKFISPGVPVLHRHCTEW